MSATALEAEISERSPEAAMQAMAVEGGMVLPAMAEAAMVLAVMPMHILRMEVSCCPVVPLL